MSPRKAELALVDGIWFPTNLLVHSPAPVLCCFSWTSRSAWCSTSGCWVRSTRWRQPISSMWTRWWPSHFTNWRRCYGRRNALRATHHMWVPGTTCHPFYYNLPPHQHCHFTVRRPSHKTFQRFIAKVRLFLSWTYANILDFIILVQTCNNILYHWSFGGGWGEYSQNILVVILMSDDLRVTNPTTSSAPDEKYISTFHIGTLYSKASY